MHTSMYTIVDVCSVIRHIHKYTLVRRRQLPCSSMTPYHCVCLMRRAVAAAHPPALLWVCGCVQTGQVAAVPTGKNQDVHMMDTCLYSLVVLFQDHRTTPPRCRCVLNLTWLAKMKNNQPKTPLLAINFPYISSTAPLLAIISPSMCNAAPLLAIIFPYISNTAPLLAIIFPYISNAPPTHRMRAPSCPQAPRRRFLTSAAELLTGKSFPVASSRARAMPTSCSSHARHASSVHVLKTARSADRLPSVEK